MHKEKTRVVHAALSFYHNLLVVKEKLLKDTGFLYKFCINFVVFYETIVDLNSIRIISFIGKLILTTISSAQAKIGGEIQNNKIHYKR